MAYVPTIINNVEFDEMLSTLGKCLDSKGTGFYNKVVGGVKCSTLELKKLELVLYLLNRKDSLTVALDCVFNGADMPGVSYKYGPPTDPSGTTPYIQTFVNYFTIYCKDCIVSDPTTVDPPVDPGDYLLLEDLSFIYLENPALSKINLE